MAGAALGTRGRLGSRSATPTAAASGNHSGPSLSRFPVRGVRMSGAGDERLHICPFALHGTELWPRVYGGIRRTTGDLSVPLAVVCSVRFKGSLVVRKLMSIRLFLIFITSF